MSPHETSLLDVDFSLAIHNRTGKYFIGQDLIETRNLPLGDVRYWWFASRKIPAGVAGKVIGRLQLWHIRGHALGGWMRILPRRRSGRALLHLDPFTVPSTVLRRRDSVLCHDIGPLTYPGLFDPDVCRIYRPIYDEIARVGPHMIFVSEASRSAFETLYPAATPASVRVIYPAIRAGVRNVSPKPIAVVHSPFLLTVGSVGARKNQLRCIEAFAQARLAERGIQYVLCGGREPGFEEVRILAAATPGVVLLDYVSDAELRWLYQSALGFVLMSHLEGFGMPVAEAIAQGLVPLVSRDSVLHEVAGDAAFLADPNDTPEIAQQMMRLVDLSDEARIDRLTALRSSIPRFELEEIRAAWRAAFADFLSTSQELR